MKLHFGWLEASNSSIFYEIYFYFASWLFWLQIVFTVLWHQIIQQCPVGVKRYHSSHFSWKNGVESQVLDAFITNAHEKTPESYCLWRDSDDCFRMLPCELCNEWYHTRCLNHDDTYTDQLKFLDLSPGNFSVKFLRISKKVSEFFKTEKDIIFVSTLMQNYHIDPTSVKFPPKSHKNVNFLQNP